MNLDDLDLYDRIDSADMHAEIAALPDQLGTAWAAAAAHPLPEMQGISRVLAAGMGGSAIGADLVAGWASPEARVPLIAWRDYGLPGWAAGPETLVTVSSHSGNTAETLSAYDQAIARGCRVLAICTGGELAARARRDGVPLWLFDHAGQPRAGVGYSFALLLAALHRLGLVPDPGAEIGEAVAAMRAQMQPLVRTVPAVRNPAKRYAGQLMDRSVTVFGAEFLAPVARRWKTQINENAKAWAQFEEIPEADHNALVGNGLPEAITERSFSMFLVSGAYAPGNARRMELTRMAYMLAGGSTDFYLAQGKGRMAQLWTALQFGDFVSYYLALACGIDPTPVDALVEFKEEMAGG